MKFRKKPVVVEATQWFPGVELPDLICVPGETGVDYGSGILGMMVIIRTLEGSLTVSPGDWIITGARGRYPCKPDIFEATYEAVADA